MSPKKSYLGDSVYASECPDGIILSTENGYGPTNFIFLDSAIIQNLFKFIESFGTIKINVEAVKNVQMKTIEHGGDTNN